jgi:hypothetical protein
MDCSYLSRLDKWATAPSAAIRQNGHRIDHAGLVLFCYPPHSPALPDKRSPTQTGDVY